MITIVRRNAYWLIVCVAVIAFSAVMAHFIERDFGRVDVQFLSFVDSSGKVLTAKLFRPVAADPQNKMPGVLNLHGGNNDKDVHDALSIELSRRGFVVLAVDGYGQGDAQGLQDSGQVFGNPMYTQGRDAGYLYLKGLPFVDTATVGIVGHSMGGIDALKLAAMHPEVKAVVSLDGDMLIQGPVNTNVLFVKNKWSDMTVGAPPLPVVNPALCRQSAPLVWGTTYGDVSNGTGCMTTLVTSNHHLDTLNPKAISDTLNWFQLTLKGGVNDVYWISPASQIYMGKELFGLIALLGTVFSLIPLTNILLTTTYFKPVAQPIPNRYAPSTPTWWLFATINALVAGITYPWFTAQGGTLGWVEKVLPFMKLGIGNGVVSWMAVNIVVCGVLFLIWYRTSGRKSGVTMYDMGVSFEKEKTRLDWGILGKTLLLGAILFIWMYVLEGISQSALGEEFRFSWPMMRQFSSPLRAGLFVLYLIPALVFFLVNGGIFLFGQIRQKEGSSPAKTQWTWWLKILYASLFGLFLVWAIQYVPWMLFGTGGLLPAWVNSFPSISIWPLELFVWLPELIVLLFMLTWFFRKTGRVYLGSLIVASILMWFFAAGSVLGV